MASMNRVEAFDTSVQLALKKTSDAGLVQWLRRLRVGNQALVQKTIILVERELNARFDNHLEVFFPETA